MQFDISSLRDDTPPVVKTKEKGSSIGMFAVKSANQWIKEASMQANPKELFGEWWHENELCILYADTNQGKSIEAVQICENIASTQLVALFDFELSGKQFEARYSEDFTNHYHFNDNFLRIEIDPDTELTDQFKAFEDFLYYSIEQFLIQTACKILVFDNITYLSTETEKAKDALPLMKLLKKLKAKYGLSILCLAHTPKRDLSKPITRNDLQGSKMLINFCDSAFAIGESTKATSIKYFKQIKVRQKAFRYDAENVAVYELKKPSNYLHFDFIEYGTEAEHLKIKTYDEKEVDPDQVLRLYSIGFSLSAIAKELSTNKSKVNRIIKAHVSSVPPVSPASIVSTS